MEFDFPKVMQAHSDAELLEIVSSQRDDYQPEALTAAEEELARRNLSPSKLKKAKAGIARKRRATRRRADEPLADGWRVFVAVFPGVMALVIARALKANGYHRKHRDVWRFTLYGTAAYALVAILFAVVAAARAH